MKKITVLYFIFNLVLLLLLSNSFIIAQPSYWSFDETTTNKISYPDLNQNKKRNFSHIKNGVHNQALVIKASAKPNLKLPFKPKNKDFSISLWFQVNDMNKYPLLYQKNGIEIGTQGSNIYIGQETMQDTECQNKTWHLLVYTFQRDTCYIDINGKQVLYLALPANYPKNNPFSIGKGRKNHFLDGAIDELEIHKRALSLPEVLQMYERYKINLKKDTKVVTKIPSVATQQPYYTPLNNTITPNILPDNIVISKPKTDDTIPHNVVISKPKTDDTIPHNVVISKPKTDDTIPHNVVIPNPKINDVVPNNIVIPNHKIDQLIVFNATNKKVEKLPFTPKKEAYSTAFWFKVLDEQEYPLLYQTQTDIKTKEIKKFIELGIKNQSLYVLQKGMDSAIEIPIANYTNKKWHLLSYTFDGQRTFKIYVDGELIHNINLGSISYQMTNRSNEIVLGMGTEEKYLHGAIDRLKFEKKEWTADEIKNILNAKVQQDPLSLQVLSKKHVINIETLLPKTKEKKPKEQRVNVVRDTINVSSTFVALELWDYDEYDNDKIDLYINGEKPIDSLTKRNLKNIKLPKERNKIVRTIKIAPDYKNEVLIFASDLGEWNVQNTAGVNIYELDENEKRISKKPLNKEPYALVCTADTNAVFKIIHESEASNETIRVGQTNTQNITLEVSLTAADMLEEIKIDDSSGTFTILNQQKIAKNTLRLVLNLKKGDLNIIPLKIGALVNVPKGASFDINLFNPTTKTNIYSSKGSRTFPFKSNFSLMLEVQHIHQEKEKIKTKPISIPKTPEINADTTIVLKNRISDLRLEIADVLRQQAEVYVKFNDITKGLKLNKKRTVYLSTIDSKKDQLLITIIPKSMGKADKSITLQGEIKTKTQGILVEKFTITLAEINKPTKILIKLPPKTKT